MTGMRSTKAVVDSLFRSDSSPAGFSQSAEWSGYNTDLAATRFSALSEINAGNVKNGPRVSPGESGIRLNQVITRSRSGQRLDTGSFFAPTAAHLNLTIRSFISSSPDSRRKIRRLSISVDPTKTIYEGRRTTHQDRLIAIAFANQPQTSPRNPAPPQ